MASAIIILILLGLLDLMLFLACVELEHQQEEWERKYDHRQKQADRGPSEPHSKV